MDALRKNFFACTGLSLKEHSGVALCRQPGQPQCFLERWTLAHDVGKGQSSASAGHPIDQFLHSLNTAQDHHKAIRGDWLGEDDAARANDILQACLWPITRDGFERTEAGDTAMHRVEDHFLVRELLLSGHCLEQQAVKRQHIAQASTSHLSRREAEHSASRSIHL